MSGQRRRPFRRVGDVLPEIAHRLGLDEELGHARAMASWQRLVEERVPAAGASRILEIRPPALVVAADDATTGQELRLRSIELLEAFATAPGGQRLLELHVIVKGPRSGASERSR